MEEELTLPPFLDRKTWTPEMWARDKARRDALLSELRRESQKVAKAAARDRAKAKAEKDAKERAKAERRALQAKREAKRKMRNAALGRALSVALEKGKLTVISLRKVLPDDLKPLAPWAVRTLFKQGKLHKAGRKVYRP